MGGVILHNRYTARPLYVSDGIYHHVALALYSIPLADVFSGFRRNRAERKRKIRRFSGRKMSGKLH
jgi:hypothetical protein